LNKYPVDFYIFKHYNVLVQPTRAGRKLIPSVISFTSLIKSHMAETGTVFSLRIQRKTNGTILIRIPLLYKSLLNPEQNISNSKWVI
jgi:hypothetical protein